MKLRLLLAFLIVFAATPALSVVVAMAAPSGHPAQSPACGVDSFRILDCRMGDAPPDVWSFSGPNNMTQTGPDTGYQCVESVVNTSRTDCAPGANALQTVIVSNPLGQYGRFCATMTRYDGSGNTVAFGVAPQGNNPVVGTVSFVPATTSVSVCTQTGYWPIGQNYNMNVSVAVGLSNQVVEFALIGTNFEVASTPTPTATATATSTPTATATPTNGGGATNTPTWTPSPTNTAGGPTATNTVTGGGQVDCGVGMVFRDCSRSCCAILRGQGAVLGQW